MKRRRELRTESHQVYHQTKEVERRINLLHVVLNFVVFLINCLLTKT